MSYSAPKIMRPMPSERYTSKLPREFLITSFACTEQILCNFKVCRSNKINSAFPKKNKTRARSARAGPMQRGSGPDPARREARRRRLNLPVGPCGQRHGGAELVPGQLGRPIKLRSTVDARHLRGKERVQRKP
jgi:hypothetical protein